MGNCLFERHPEHPPLSRRRTSAGSKCLVSMVKYHGHFVKYMKEIARSVTGRGCTSFWLHRLRALRFGQKSRRFGLPRSFSVKRPFLSRSSCIKLRFAIILFLIPQNPLFWPCIGSIRASVLHAQKRRIQGAGPPPALHHRAQQRSRRRFGAPHRRRPLRASAAGFY